MGKTGFNLEKRKSELSGINNNLEKKKQQLEQLKEQKESLFNERMAIEGKKELDEFMINRIKESINEDVENNRKKSMEVSSEMNDDLKNLEDMKQEIQEDVSGANETRNRLEKTKELLGRFGIGKGLERGISDIDAHLSDMNSFKDEVTEKMREMENISKELSGI